MVRSLVLLLMMCMCLAPIVGHAAPGAQEARQFVDTVGQRVLKVVNATDMGDDQRQQQLQQMFLQYVDIPWMGRFVLGHGWQQANQDQRNRYLEAYKHYLLARYTTNFSHYTGSNYTITDVKEMGDGEFMVNMRIKTPQQNQETEAAYRLRTDESGQFKIIDIVVEGVSLLTTQRADFASVLQQKGMEALIAEITAKGQAASSGAGKG